MCLHGGVELVFDLGVGPGQVLQFAKVDVQCSLCEDAWQMVLSGLYPRIILLLRSECAMQLMFYSLDKKFYLTPFDMQYFTVCQWCSMARSHCLDYCGLVVHLKIRF